MKWLIYTRGTVPPYRMSLFLHGFKTGFLKDDFYKYYKLLVSSEGEKTWFAWDETRSKKYGKTIIEKCKSKSKFEKYSKFLMDEMQTSINLSNKIDKLDLKKYDNDRLGDLLQTTMDEFVRINTFLIFDIDIFDIVFDKYLLNEINKEFDELSKSDIGSLYDVLSTPVCKTFVQKEELSILKAVSKDKISTKDIDYIYKKYWWTSVGWESIKPKNYKYFEKEIQKIKKEQAEKRIKEINKHIADIKKKRNKFYEKYCISKHIKHLVNVADVVTQLHDIRKEMQVRNIHTSYLILKEISKRVNKKVTYLEWLWLDEINSLLKGESIDDLLVNNRKKAVFVYIDNYKYKELLGKNAVLARKKQLKINTNNKKTIKGQVAMKGCVTGIARVCNGAKDALSKVKKGDILVCGMTLPDYVPAMKRAGAIVTDEGGITSHAAIISREYNTPCIIGTKISTHVLKDGDKIKVDADKGMVRIIK